MRLKYDPASEPLHRILAEAEEAEETYGLEQRLTASASASCLFTLVTGPRRSLSLELSLKYEPAPASAALPWAGPLPLPPYCERGLCTSRRILAREAGEAEELEQRLTADPTEFDLAAAATVQSSSYTSILGDI